MESTNTKIKQLNKQAKRDLILVIRKSEFALHNNKLSNVLAQIQENISEENIDIKEAFIKFENIYDSHYRCDNTVVTISYESCETSYEHDTRVSKESDQ